MARGKGAHTYNVLQLKVLGHRRLGLLEVEQIARYLHVPHRALANNLKLLAALPGGETTPVINTASLQSLPHPWRTHLCGIAHLPAILGLHRAFLDEVVPTLPSTSEPFSVLSNPRAIRDCSGLYRETIASLCRLMKSSDAYMEGIGLPVQHRHLHLAHFPNFSMGVYSVDAGPVAHIHSGMAQRNLQRKSKTAA